MGRGEEAKAHREGINLVALGVDDQDRCVHVGDGAFIVPNVGHQIGQDARHVRERDAPVARRRKRARDDDAIRRRFLSGPFDTGFALLVTPAATAERLVTRPSAALLLSVMLALLFTWGGLVIAYYLPYSLGFFITTLAFGTYLGVRVVKDGPWRAKRFSLAAQDISKGGVS